MAQEPATIPAANRALHPTELDQKLHETMTAWFKLQEERDRFSVMLSRSEETNRQLMAENESQMKRIVDLEHRLNYFIRHSTEVATRIIDVKRVIDMAGETIDAVMIDAQRAGYRPPPPGTPREAEGDDGAPIPSFLQTPNEPEERIEGELPPQKRDITHG